MGKADAGNHKPRKRGTFRSVFSGIVFTIPCQRRGRIAPARHASGGTV